MSRVVDSDFPVPEDLTGVWQWDKAHFPRPLTPLTAEIVLGAISTGFTRAMDESSSPYGIAFRAINCWAYSGSVPLDPDAESPEARQVRHRLLQEEQIATIPSRWANEWLPEVKSGIERARAIDYAALGDAALLDTLDELCDDFVERWVVHGRLVPHYVAPSRFFDFYMEALQPDDPTEPYLLLHGFPTRATEAERGLWRLGRTAYTSPSLRALFSASDAAELPARLAESGEGRAFLAELDAYLDEFGWRNDGTMELALPAWREDRSVPLAAIRGYVLGGAAAAAANPDVRLQAAAELRERLLNAARARLAAEPERLARFNALYEHARPHLVVDEDHNFFIDQVGTIILRLPLLELGRRLVRRGVVTGEDDVFYLHRGEICDAMAGVDARALVARRRQEMAAWGRSMPPVLLGEAVEDAEADEFALAMTRMDGVPPPESDDSRLVIGAPGSPGTARGRARVVHSLEEATALEPGEVLVCETTMPPWTPLIALASAVVADSGGVLSHCAIVAREYGIPCVVGTGIGTAAIETGMALLVDGSRGLVRIEDENVP